MSLAGVGQLLRSFGIAAILGVTLPAGSWAQSCAPCAIAAPSCGQSCQWLHCPPGLKHCQEGPPCIHWHCGCPHPICNPCDLPHFGYWETCWYPWPHPPTACPTPTPASMVSLNPYLNPNMPPHDPRQPRNATNLGGAYPAPQGTAPTPRTPMTLPSPNAPIDELPPPRTLRPGQ